MRARTTRAQVESAEAAFARAQRNREYAEITSPIDGVVMKRDVAPGQTVAASFQTPTLFVIAQDLTRMQILANVDESEIGR
ncbi:MAG: HlyD family efflux transporter periplasmic adaptor subunit, partial [Burkholderiales bacterium]